MALSLPPASCHSLDGGVRIAHDHAQVLQGHICVLLHHRQAGALARAQGLILPLEVGDLRLGSGREGVLWSTGSSHALST